MKDMGENKVYSVLEARDKLPKDSTGEPNALDTGNNQRIVYHADQSKGCDQQCIDCFLVFCEK